MIVGREARVLADAETEPVAHARKRHAEVVLVEDPSGGPRRLLDYSAGGAAEITESGRGPPARRPAAQNCR